MGKPQSIAQQARNRLGVTARLSPQNAGDARRDLAAAKLEQHIREAVESAPELTAEQRERLALLLNPGR